MIDKIKAIFNQPTPLVKTVLFESAQEEKEVEVVEEKPSKVEVESGITFDDSMKALTEKFLTFVAENLQLQEYPTIKVLAKRQGGMTYGAFNPADNSIMVLGKSRGLADIFRTVAHELTHYKQKVEGRIPSDLKGRDLKLEAEANTKAGDLIYMFGLQNPQVYELVVASN